MGFSDQQLSALRRKLNKSFIHSRQVQGRTLSYIEGWHAIAEANRIFGFDGWDRETVETKCVLGRENRGAYHAVYVAKVRITVRAQDRRVVRDGYGTGEAHGNSAGETHERALKTAETDATKRALATFGKPFGLSLYISTSRPRDETFNPIQSPPIADEDRRRTAQKLDANGRYYVPARRRVPLDPDLTAAQTGQSDVPDRAPNDREKARWASAQETGMGSQSSAAAEAPGRDFRAPQPMADKTLPDNASLVPPLQTDAPARSTSLDPDQIPLADSEAPALQDLSVEGGRLLIDWPKRRREPAHLDHVRSQPCLLCGRTPSDAHHLRFAQTRAMGRKVSDEFTVPLCRTHHRQLHRSGNEVNWWEGVNPDVDPLRIANELWEESQRKFSTPGKTDKPMLDGTSLPKQ